jgi:hypothetical protein
VAEDDINQSIDALNSAQEKVSVANTFDNYRSVADPNLVIFVENDTAPPFRFKVGGWELLQSAMDLGPAMKARIAEKGFFMFRVNEDQVGGVELSDPQTPLAEAELKVKGK